VAMDALAKESTSILQRLLKSGIELSVISSAETWQVLADPAHLDQVIMNLTVNAQDAMPNGGKLTIETANIVVDEALSHTEVTIPPGNYVMLAISDTGVGMDTATQAHIFEPFFTTKESGTGLGLAIVYGVVKQNRGYVLVSSELGKGTTFKIYLPAVREAATPAFVADEPMESRQADETILLADDEVGMREIVKQFLEQNGYTVLTACDGLEAMQIAERHPGPINVLLTDVIMPRMRGPELANNMARFRPDIKIVYMSGYTENAGLLEGDLARGREYLHKPFQLSELANTLHKMLIHPPSSEPARELTSA
jgi:two-component system, cell cycle sensor histidine kinase and response regulator CckA